MSRYRALSKTFDFNRVFNLNQRNENFNEMFFTIEYVNDVTINAAYHYNCKIVK